MEQGKLLTTDKIIYFDSSLNLNGSGTVIQVNSVNYTIIPEGVQTYSINGSSIYSKVFIRKTFSGSLW
jgi:hypothetical protein